MNRQKKIQVIMIGPGSDEKGGIATVIKNFKEVSLTADVGFTYITSWQAGSLLKRGLTFIKACLQLMKLLRVQPNQLVHLHVAQDGSFFRKKWLARLAIAKGAKVIVHLHGSQFDVFYRKGTAQRQKEIRQFLLSASQVVVLSQEWVEFIQEIVPLKARVIENAVKLPETNEYSQVAQRVVTFGRIGQRKGSYDILRVAKLLEKKLPKVSFHLYGDGEVSALRDLIKSEKLTNVKIEDWVSNAVLSDSYKQAALHLLPSYHEGLPMAILETMANGIPNIASTVGGIPQVIQHNRNGLLVEAGDVRGIADYVYELMSNTQRRVAMSQAAYLTIERAFENRNYYQKWYTLYQEVAREGEKE